MLKNQWLIMFLKMRIIFLVLLLGYSANFNKISQAFNLQQTYKFLYLRIKFYFLVSFNKLSSYIDKYSISYNLILNFYL